MDLWQQKDGWILQLAWMWGNSVHVQLGHNYHSLKIGHMETKPLSSAPVRYHRLSICKDNDRLVSTQESVHGTSQIPSQIINMHLE